MVNAHSASKTGPVRTVNEDSSLVEPGVGVYAVADGMGGHNAGEVASALALEALGSFMRRSASDNDLSWPYGVDPALSLHANRLRTAIHLANRRVFREAESRDDYTGMGTTVAAVLVTADAVVCAHVGDSRIYRLSNGAVSQVTHDDSWAAALQSQGVTSRELARHPMRHVLTNVVGARDQVDVHIIELPRTAGDRFLICSDGLHEVLDEAALREILSSSPDVRTAAERLVGVALERGSRDNVTALVVHCEATS